LRGFSIIRPLFHEEEAEEGSDEESEEEDSHADKYDEVPHELASLQKRSSAVLEQGHEPDRGQRALGLPEAFSS
jgi:hypothetical protein